MAKVEMISSVEVKEMILSTEMREMIKLKEIMVMTLQTEEYMMIS